MRREAEANVCKATVGADVSCVDRCRFRLMPMAVLQRHRQTKQRFCPLTLALMMFMTCQKPGRASPFVEARTQRSAIPKGRSTIPFAVLSTLEAFSALPCAKVHFDGKRTDAVRKNQSCWRREIMAR